MADIETIELNSLEEPKVINADATISSLPSVNFGPGADLLMNDKKLNSESNNIESDINLGDLENLEDELSSSMNKDVTSSFQENQKSTLFGGSEDKIKINILDPSETSFEKTNDATVPNQETQPSKPVNERTWDGFATFNDIPIGETIKETKPQMTKEELLREKFAILKKLEDLEKKGVELTKKYNMESSLAEMQGEYETIIAEKEKSNSVKFQGRMLMAAITGLEFLNNKFDPFDLKLDGWAEQINEGIDDYDEIFAELHDKYKTKAKMAPELKLMFQLGGGAVMLHMTNTMFKTSMPGMDDIMRENPDLMEQFTKAAVDKMGNENPGLSGFMNNIMQPDIPTPSGPPPPPPERTQGRYSENVNDRQSGVRISNRPDLSYGRGNMQDGISISETFETANDTQEKSKRVDMREEMSGPTDINEILNGLKNKSSEDESLSLNIHDKPMKSKPKRKNRSDKNTISLNI
tara:strand:- start:2148 stop:3545 length:1398 start_codon:yes stop_codon:yes gene_type:complete